MAKGRVPFSERDDKNLVKYIAEENPQAEGRKGNELFKRLFEDGDSTWCKRHTWQSWRDHYVKNTGEFDRKIKTYLRWKTREREKKREKLQKKKETEENTPTQPKRKRESEDGPTESKRVKTETTVATVKVTGLVSEAHETVAESESESSDSTRARSRQPSSDDYSGALEGKRIKQEKLEEESGFPEVITLSGSEREEVASEVLAWTEDDPFPFRPEETADLEEPRRATNNRPKLKPEARRDDDFFESIPKSPQPQPMQSQRHVLPRIIDGPFRMTHAEALRARATEEDFQSAKWPPPRSRPLPNGVRGSDKISQLVSETPTNEVNASGNVSKKSPPTPAPPPRITVDREVQSGSPQVTACKSVGAVPIAIPIATATKVAASVHTTPNLPENVPLPPSRCPTPAPLPQPAIEEVTFRPPMTSSPKDNLLRPSANEKQLVRNASETIVATAVSMIERSGAPSPVRPRNVSLPMYPQSPNDPFLVISTPPTLKPKTKLRPKDKGKGKERAFERPVDLPTFEFDKDGRVGAGMVDDAARQRLIPPPPPLQPHLAAPRIDFLSEMARRQGKTSNHKRYKQSPLAASRSMPSVVNIQEADATRPSPNDVSAAGFNFRSAVAGPSLVGKTEGNLRRPTSAKNLHAVDQERGVFKKPRAPPLTRSPSLPVSAYTTASHKQRDADETVYRSLKMKRARSSTSGVPPSTSRRVSILSPMPSISNFTFGAVTAHTNPTGPPLGSSHLSTAAVISLAPSPPQGDPTSLSVAPQDYAVLLKLGFKSAVEHMSKNHGFTEEVVMRILKETGDLGRTDEVLKRMREAAERAVEELGNGTERGGNGASAVERQAWREEEETQSQMLAVTRQEEEEETQDMEVDTHNLRRSRTNGEEELTEDEENERNEDVEMSDARQQGHRLVVPRKTKAKVNASTAVATTTKGKNTSARKRRRSSEYSQHAQSYHQPSPDILRIRPQPITPAPSVRSRLSQTSVNAVEDEYVPPSGSRAGRYQQLVRQGKKEEALERERRMVTFTRGEVFSMKKGGKENGRRNEIMPIRMDKPENGRRAGSLAPAAPNGVYRAEEMDRKKSRPRGSVPMSISGAMSGAHTGAKTRSKAKVPSEENHDDDNGDEELEREARSRQGTRSKSTLSSNSNSAVEVRRLVGVDNGEDSKEYESEVDKSAAEEESEDAEEDEADFADDERTQRRTQHTQEVEEVGEDPDVGAGNTGDENKGPEAEKPEQDQDEEESENIPRPPRRGAKKDPVRLPGILKIQPNLKERQKRNESQKDESQSEAESGDEDVKSDSDAQEEGGDVEDTEGEGEEESQIQVQAQKHGRRRQSPQPIRQNPSFPITGKKPTPQDHGEGDQELQDQERSSESEEIGQSQADDMRQPQEEQLVLPPSSPPPELKSSDEEEDENLDAGDDVVQLRHKMQTQEMSKINTQQPIEERAVIESEPSQKPKPIQACASPEQHLDSEQPTGSYLDSDYSIVEAQQDQIPTSDMEAAYYHNLNNTASTMASSRIKQESQSQHISFSNNIDVDSEQSPERIKDPEVDWDEKEVGTMLGATKETKKEALRLEKGVMHPDLLMQWTANQLARFI